jgi:hypothetical protein
MIASLYHNSAPGTLAFLVRASIVAHQTARGSTQKDRQPRATHPARELQKLHLEFLPQAELLCRLEPPLTARRAAKGRPSDEVDLVCSPSIGSAAVQKESQSLLPVCGRRLHKPLACKDHGACGHTSEKYSSCDQHHHANWARRCLEASHLSVQEFPVVAVHVHLDQPFTGENSQAVYLFRRLRLVDGCAARGKSGQSRPRASAKVLEAAARMHEHSKLPL